MHGLLDESRTEAIGQQYSDDEQALNKALERQGEWRKFVVGAASTKRAIVNPVSSDTCGLPSSNMSLGTGGCVMARNPLREPSVKTRVSVADPAPYVSPPSRC